MNSNTILIKVKERLNKRSSQDYQNLPPWKILEAFNKGQLEWCRRNLHGANAATEGDQQSTSRIDDLQKIIKSTNSLTFTDKGDYFQSALSAWPVDYMRFDRFDLTAVNTCCNVAKSMTVYQVEDANWDVLKKDPNRNASYDWGETIAVIKGNLIHILHNGKFTVKQCSMSYYRRPVIVQMIGVKNIYTGANSTANVSCEFTDDLAELLVDEAATIIAGDIENAGQANRLNQRVEKNN